MSIKRSGVVSTSLPTKTGLGIKRLKISAPLFSLVLRSTRNYAFSVKWITIIASCVKRLPLKNILVFIKAHKNA